MELIVYNQLIINCFEKLFQIIYCAKIMLDKITDVIIDINLYV